MRSVAVAVTLLASLASGVYAGPAVQQERRDANANSTCKQIEDAISSASALHWPCALFSQIFLVCSEVMSRLTLHDFVSLNL